MKIKNTLYTVMAALTLILGAAACTPDKYALGENNITSEDLQEGVAYTITADSSNPNIVYLENKMGSNHLAQWETPQGRFQGDKVTLKIPFSGTYEVTFGIDTRAGVVYGKPVNFTVSDICTDFITSEVWTLLSGGVNQEKTWVYDTGEYGFAAGELTYGSPDDNANLSFGHFTANWDPGKDHCGESTMWNSYMTFSLKGSAGYTFYNSTSDTKQEGVFSLNEDTYVLSFTDAELMHPDSWDDRYADWGKNFQIVELDEDHMRVVYKRQAGSWGGEWLEAFNYVSKDFADSYVPPVDDNPAPTLADTWIDDISSLNRTPNTYREIKWVLTDGSDATSYYDLYGSLDGGSQTASDAGAEMSLVLNSVDMTYSMTDVDGNEKAGTYSIASDGFITFSDGLLEVAAGSDGTIFKTNADNTLRVLSYTMDGTEITDLVLGYDLLDVHGDRYKYQAFHFIPKVVGGTEQVYFKAGLHYFSTTWSTFASDVVKITGDGVYTFKISGSDSDPYGMYLDVVKILAKYPNFDMTITDIRVDGVSITFDDSQIDRMGGEEKDAAGNKITARRYILNPWNSETNYFMVNGFAVLSFTSTIEVDIKVTFDSGTPFPTN